MSRTLLHTDFSACSDGAESRQLSTRFARQWVENHPEYKVEVRTIFSTPLPHLVSTLVA